MLLPEERRICQRSSPFLGSVCGSRVGSLGRSRPALPPTPCLSWGEGDRRRATVPQGLPYALWVALSPPGAEWWPLGTSSRARAGPPARPATSLGAQQRRLRGRRAASFLSGRSQDGCAWPLASGVRPSGPSSGPEGSCPSQAARPLPEFRALRWAGRCLLTPASVSVSPLASAAAESPRCVLATVGQGAGCAFLRDRQTNTEQKAEGDT